MPFGMGFGELVLILVIVVVVFGATKLPGLEGGLRGGIERFRDRLQRPERPPGRLRLVSNGRSSRRWTLSDWLLVCAAVAAGAIALLAFVVRSR